jgi:hypothetical protein
VPEYRTLPFLYLALRPALQGFVPQLTDFLNHPPLGFIRPRYLPSTIFYSIQDRFDTTLQHGMGLQPLVYTLLTQG